MKSNELDKLCLMNYVIGGFVAIASLVGIVITLFFKDLFPTAFHYGHSGLGTIQFIVCIVLVIIGFCALKFIEITKTYQDNYGA